MRWKNLKDTMRYYYITITTMVKIFFKNCFFRWPNQMLAKCEKTRTLWNLIWEPEPPITALRHIFSCKLCGRPHGVHPNTWISPTRRSSNAIPPKPCPMTTNNYFQDTVFMYEKSELPLCYWDCHVKESSKIHSLLSSIYLIFMEASLFI